MYLLMLTALGLSSSLPYLPMARELLGYMWDLVPDQEWNWDPLLWKSEVLPIGLEVPN